MGGGSGMHIRTHDAATYGGAVRPAGNPADTWLLEGGKSSGRRLQVVTESAYQLSRLGA